MNLSEGCSDRVDPAKPTVRGLQTALLAAGFSPGLIDGEFGPATEAAVLAFQKSEGLEPDGVVGPITSAALFGEPIMRAGNMSASAMNSGISAALVSKIFPFVSLSTIQRNLPSILEALHQESLLDKPMLCMALATIAAEVPGFEPVTEGVSRYNTSPGGKPFDLYDMRKDLGNSLPGDGQCYAGRGYVQLTGKANYLTFSDALGINLVFSPRLANQPETAATILAKFLKRGEVSIRQALEIRDLAAARKLVNGGTHGLSAFGDAFDRAQDLLP